MPSIEDDDYAVERMKRKRAKLISKGIDPRSNKFRKLLFRR